MNIHVYSLGWNEEQFLPFFLRHYCQFATKIVYYDNQSTDKTAEIARACPILELRSYDSGGYADEHAFLHIKNNAWKESKGTADWVIICDTDEIVYHPHLLNHLAECQERGITMLDLAGYEMIAYEFPLGDARQIYEICADGYENNGLHAKRMVFNPAYINEINYEVGCHVCHPEGQISFGSGAKMLHYHYVGLDYTHESHIRRRPRTPTMSKEHGWGVQHWSDYDRLKIIMTEMKNRSSRIIQEAC